MIKKINIAEVTYSVRNTTINGLDIKENDFIGLFDDNILTKGTTPEETFLSLLQTVKEKLQNAEFISIYYGKDVKKEDGEAMVEKLSEIFKDVEFDLVYGGQPFYYYIASIE